MRAIETADPKTWAGLQFVFTDIDDTLTTDGRLGADAYAMLEQLAGSDIVVVPVTGRPAGWCDMIARFWPVGAVVGENGAFYFRYDHASRKLIRNFAQTDEVRMRNRRSLAVLRDKILSDVAGAALASDQAFRDTDLAIDFCEDVARLPDESINRIVEHFEASGATAKVSSIHVNGWFGSHDKLTMTKKLMREAFDLHLDTAVAQSVCAFIGDSPNDAPMFDFFDNSVGVANIADFADRCEALPKWVTAAASGTGFCEFAAAVLKARTA